MNINEYSIIVYRYRKSFQIILRNKFYNYFKMESEKEAKERFFERVTRISKYYPYYQTTGF